MDTNFVFGYHLIILFILGAAVGSFLNVVAYRFPRGESFISPPSSCPSCGKRLQAVDLVPVLSYIFLRGSCRRCKARISVRYFFVEVITGLIFVVVPLFKGLNMEAAFYLFFLCLLLTVSLVDLEFHRIPNVFLMTGLVGGIILRVLNPASRNLEAWSDAGLGMLAGGGIMLVIYILGRGGMGAGDLKLMIVVGFFLGLQGTVLSLLAGFIMGGIFGLIMLILRKMSRKEMVPFGPFLSLGAAIMVFYGEQILSWYMNFY